MNEQNAHESQPNLVRKRPRIALLFSGGGYRATLFHLGVLRFLHESTFNDADGQIKPLTSCVDRIVGVSGGSIAAAHFANRFQDFQNDFDAASKQLIDFVGATDIRRIALASGRNKDSSQARTVECFQRLFDTKATSDIDDQVRLDILGTDLNSGDGIAFSSEGLFSLRTSIDQEGLNVAHLACIKERLSTELAKAVAASTAFPPVFSPLVLDGTFFDDRIDELSLQPKKSVADGGIRDNLGLEFYQHSPSECSLLIICDAGYPFDWSGNDFAPQVINSWITRLRRVVDIQSLKISFLDREVTTGASLHQGRRFVSIADDCSDRCDELNKDTPGIDSLASQRRHKAKKIKTDLAPLSPPDIYAVISQGCAIARKQLLPIFDIKVESADSSRCEFWDKIKVVECEEIASQSSHFDIAEDLARHLPSTGNRFADLILSGTPHIIANRGKIAFLIGAVSPIAFVMLMALFWFRSRENARLTPLATALVELAPSYRYAFEKDVVAKCYTHDEVPSPARRVSTFFLLGRSVPEPADDKAELMGTIKIQTVDFEITEPTNVELRGRTSGTDPTAKSRARVYLYLKNKNKLRVCQENTATGVYTIQLPKGEAQIVILAVYSDGLPESKLMVDPYVVEVDDYGRGSGIEYLFAAAGIDSRHTHKGTWAVIPSEDSPSILSMDEHKVEHTWVSESISSLKNKLLPLLIDRFDVDFEPESTRSRAWMNTLGHLSKSEDDVFLGDCFQFSADRISRDMIHIIEWRPESNDAR